MQKLATMIRNLATSSRVPRPCHQSFTSFSFSWRQATKYNFSFQLRDSVFSCRSWHEKLRGKRSDLAYEILQYE